MKVSGARIDCTKIEPSWYDRECHRDDLEIRYQGGLLPWILHKIIA